MKRELIILIAAVLMGIAAVVLNEIRVASIKWELESQMSNPVQVCSMTRGAGQNALMQEDLLTQKQIPEAFRHPLSVLWKDRSLIIGQRLRHPMRQGQPVLWSDMAESSKRTIGDSILPGRGVVTIPIDIIGGVSGLISPGSRVDIFGVFKVIPMEGEDKKEYPVRWKPGDQLDSDMINSMMRDAVKKAKKNEESKDDTFYVLPVAENLGVFAVGTRTQMDAQSSVRGGYSTISFDVPRDLQVVLIMAAHMAERDGGRLICVLRSNEGGDDAAMDDQLKAYWSAHFLDLVQRGQSKQE